MAIIALAMDIQGNLYEGGEIVSAGGIPVGNVAKWDGVTCPGDPRGAVQTHFLDSLYIQNFKILSVQ